jgi:hypothetical protein
MAIMRSVCSLLNSKDVCFVYNAYSYMYDITKY